MARHSTKNKHLVPTAEPNSDDEDEDVEIDNENEEEEEEEQSDEESRNSQEENENEDEDEKSENELNDEEKDEEESPAKTEEKTQTLKTTGENSDSESHSDNNTKETTTPKPGTQIIIPNASAKDDRSTITITESLSLSSDAKAKKDMKMRKRLNYYKKQENRRKKRMKIKSEAYRLINPDLNVSESEAEADDEELEYSSVAMHRTETLKRLYTRNAKKKATEQIRTNIMHQAMIGRATFDGTVRGLNTFMIDLKSTCISRSWRNLFVMPLPENRRVHTTGYASKGTMINYLDNPQSFELQEIIDYNNSNSDLIKNQRNERKNLHTAIWNSISHGIRNRMASSGTNITDGVVLVAWIYHTYSMQTEEARKNFLSKITNLSITRSKNLELFLTYVESIINDGNVIGQDQKEMLRDATFRELTKITSSTFTSTLLAYKMNFENNKQQMPIEDLIARARKEYKAEKAADTWHDTTFTRTTRPRKTETEQVVALKAEINRLQQGRLPTHNQGPRKRAPDWGEGTDFETKDDFWNWKWSRPANITKPETKNNKTWWFCTRCNWRTGHTVETCRKPEGAQPRQRPPPPYQPQQAYPTNQRQSWDSQPQYNPGYAHPGAYNAAPPPYYQHPSQQPHAQSSQPPIQHSGQDQSGFNARQQGNERTIRWERQPNSNTHQERQPENSWSTQNNYTNTNSASQQGYGQNRSHGWTASHVPPVRHERGDEDPPPSNRGLNAFR